MFKNPFSIKGRIRRTEYGISIIIMYALFFILGLVTEATGLGESIIYIVFIPAYWFIIAQGAKRCHYRGNSGWFQFIPLYSLWMLFAESEFGQNKYGPNPKAIGNLDQLDDF